MLEETPDCQQETLKKGVLLDAIKQDPTLICKHFDLSKCYPQSKINFDLVKWKMDLIDLALSNYDRFAFDFVQLLKQDFFARKVVQKIASKKPRLFFGKPNKEALRKFESALSALQCLEKSAESTFKNAPTAVFFTPDKQSSGTPSYARSLHIGSRVFKART